MSYDIKSHPLTININLLSKHESNVWQNPNDPDDENEHFKQPLIAIEQCSLCIWNHFVFNERAKGIVVIVTDKFMLK